MGYQWAGRYAEAIQEYERALELKPNFDISVIHLANTFYQTGQYRHALQEFQHYTEVVPSVTERVRAYRAIAQLQRSRGRLSESERAARQSFATSPIGATQMFRCALEKGDLAAAETFKLVLEQFRTRDRGGRGDLRELPFCQGLFELKSGRPAQAIEKFKESLQYRAPNCDIDPYEDSLANAYLELGRFDEAIAKYERILKLNPNYPLIQYHLAQVYEGKGERAKARVAYERFLQIWKDADSDVPEVVRARKFLSS